MERENRKEAVAALHRDQILKAAEKLFSEKGYTQTTIDDISKASEYSRRTIYIYFESKEEILYQIIEKGLQTLKSNIEYAVKTNNDFIKGYRDIFMAMGQYQREHPHSIDMVNHSNTAALELSDASDTVNRILELGSEINKILESFIEGGKKSGIVRNDIVPMLTVYVLWSSIQSFLTLAETKGQFLCAQYAMTKDEFLEYGFKQIINSILEMRI